LEKGWAICTAIEMDPFLAFCWLRMGNYKRFIEYRALVDKSVKALP